MHNKIILRLILLLTCLFHYGCKSAQPQGQVLAKINDYDLTVEDFEAEMEHSP